jgi:ureidoglycolate hydrolase
VFGKEVEAGFGAVIETITTMTSDIMAGETARYSQLSTELTNELAALTAAIRTELRIDKAD